MSEKKGKLKNKDPKRYRRPIPPGPMRATLAQRPRPTKAELCELIEGRLNKEIRKRCAEKEFEEAVGNCEGGGGAAAMVDLVVVIDTSGSMNDEAANLSNAADAAIQAAAQSCPSDLRVVWLGIEGTWAGTKFNQSYRSYLTGLPGVGNADLIGTPGDFEDGAAAVIDLADHFDWRAGAARAIFYLGDEALEGGDPQNAGDVAAADAAIAAAGGVTVFTYFGTGSGNPVTQAEYARLANQTGGQAFTAPINLAGFQTVLEQIICASLGEACQTVEEPQIVPCLHLRWGDGPRDRIETDDTEVLCLTVCNPYSNVMLRDFTLHLVVTDAAGGPVPTLPDGTPSVEIKPDFMICFGDVPPCNPKDQKQPSCVSREVVLMTCGAKEGKYRIFVAYCFEACFTQLEVVPAFTLDLVKS